MSNIPNAPSPLKALGAYLKKCRESADMTQEKLSQKSKYHSRYLSTIEQGRSRPSLNVLRTYANECGANTDKLILLFTNIVKAETTEQLKKG